MKQTLREKIETMLKELQGRSAFLESSIKDYVAHGNLSDAAICQIKKTQFDIIIDSLNKALA